MNLRGMNFKKIFLDRDRDGIVDTVNLQIHLSHSCSHSEILSAVMDLCASIGFETMGTNLPIVTAGIRMDSSFRHHLFIGLNHELKGNSTKNGKNIYFLMGKDESSLTKSIRGFTLSLISKNGKLFRDIITRRFERRKGFNLLNPFSREGFYEASVKHPLSTSFPYKILIFSHLRMDATVEAANFATRLGLESLHLSLPLTFSLSAKPKNGKPFIYIGKKEDLKRVGLKGFSDLLYSKWDSGIFLVPSKKDIPDVLICGEEEGVWKILRYLSILPTDSKGTRDPIFREVNRFTEDLREHILRGPSHHPLSSPERIVRDYIIDDEKDEIIKMLEKDLRKISFKPISIKIEILITKPEEERRRLAGEIKGLLKNLGLNKKEICLTVLNAYKPGLSWMKEVVLKEIARKKVDRVEIAFKEFREKGLEEPIRWLQEIYPIDEIFARELAISKERIEFKRDSRIKEIYRVRAWRRGKRVYEAQFSPKWRKMDYLLPFPRLGKVHPCTGWVGVKIDGKEIIGQKVRTGVEQIWEIFRKEILSLIKKEADSVLSEKKLPTRSPIFEELRFDIYLNYPMEELGVNEERISPLEALHEDIYFVTLDYFSNYLKRKGVSNLSAGRILPIIHPNYQKEKGKLKFTLIHHLDGISDKNRKVKISLNGVAFRGSDALADLFIGAGGRESLNWLRERSRSYQNLQNGAYRIERVFEEEKPRKRLRIIAIGSDLIRKKSFEHKRKIKPIDIPMERPIGYQEGLNLIRSLEGLHGVNIVYEGISSGGLPIYSIEHTYPCPSHFVSHGKMAALKSTFFINCRHHANEISSTNAGLKLSYLLASQQKYHDLLKRVNVVINPMENVDGVLILDEMLKLTPRDKLHAGRYNQAGREYYGEYFNPETPFGEARVKPDIWRRWLPDICVDNHGFPSHEWEQPFSGYAPFRFREWWIPRALFYFYLPFLEGKADSFKRIHSERLKRWISTSVFREKEIIKWNLTFSDRYWKYRGQWVSPRLKMNGPIECLPLQKRFRRTNYSYRYPHITTIDFITEVADEVVQGKFLRNCISAHLKTNLAIIKLLNSLNFLVKKRCHIDKKDTHFIWYRERPLNIKM